MIAKEALQATRVLGQINSHHETPAQVLGMTGEITREKNSALRSIEKQHIAELSDGSELFLLDQAVHAMIREGLPPGSLIETGVMRSTPNTPEQIQGFLNFDAVAIVLRHEQDKTVLLGFVRSPRPEEQEKGMRQGMWGEYVIDGTSYQEKNDARMALSRLFSTTQGIEGSQMLSMIFQSNMISGNGTDKKISEAGCFSHEKPMQAIPINLLHGTAMPIPIELRPSDTTRIIRVRTSPQTDSFSPLYGKGDVDEEHILSMGLISRAHHIAKENPTGMGAGTQPGKVLTAMLETTTMLPELVGNGGKMVDARTILKHNLGIR